MAVIRKRFFKNKDLNFIASHSRLAITGIEDQSAIQPIMSPSKRYLVLFNGEIYNYIQLMREHKINVPKNSSDTVILIYLIDKLGIEFANLLEGIFSIAIIDLESKKFYCFRDHIGSNLFIIFKIKNI